jgi:hypothetical protein
MSALDNYAANKKELVDALTAWGTELNDAVETNTLPAARQTLKATADATYELVEYVNSPIIDRAIQTFHTSAAERALAARDLKKYLSDAGLESSDRVRWELYDNNWCVDAQVTVSYHDESGGVHPVTVSGHYDSHTGFGSDVC